MSRESLWKDPLPPERFAPEPEVVELILDQAALPPPERVRRPMPGRLAGGIAAAALLLAASYFGSRGMTRLLGDTVLPPQSGAPAPMSQAANEQEREEGAAPAPAAGTLAALPTLAPAPETSDATAQQDARVSDYKMIFGGHGSVTLGDVEDGVFTGRQSLRGEMIPSMELEARLTGQVILCATWEEGEFVLPQGPCVLQVYGEALYGYDASGTLVYSFSGISLEQIVEKLIQEDIQDGA